jgi:hypothetical protein
VNTGNLSSVSFISITIKESNGILGKVEEETVSSPIPLTLPLIVVIVSIKILLGHRKMSPLGHITLSRRGAGNPVIYIIYQTSKKGNIILYNFINKIT